MKADPRFLAQPKEFWANVRTISQEVGYTQRGANAIKIPSLESIRKEFTRLGLGTAHLADKDGNLTDFGQRLFEYFVFRAAVLNETVQGCFMRKEAAEVEFTRLKDMGYVDEVVFGREVLTRLPELAREWKAAYDSQSFSQGSRP